MMLSSGRREAKRRTEQAFDLLRASRRKLFSLVELKQFK